MSLSKSEYLKTPEGQLCRRLWRTHNLSLYSFDFEPKSKEGMRNPEKVVFQQELLKQIKERGKQAYRGKIVVNLSFHATNRNPPQVHTVTKNFLDLFSSPLPETKIKRKSLVYQDDKQIAYLAVRYFIGDDKPYVSVQAKPFRDFLLDLEVINSFLLDEDTNRHSENDDDNWDNYNDLLRNKDRYIRLIGQKGYKGMLESCKILLQGNLIKQSMLKLRDIVILYIGLGPSNDFCNSKDRKIDNFIAGINNTVREWILKFPLRVLLPQVPTKPGDTNNFRIKVRESIKSYKNQFRILSKIIMPIYMEVLYKPPCVSQGFSKDLDNIMKLITPVVYEELTPPLSLQGYEVFELPRQRKDVSDGFLTIDFTSGYHNLGTVWDRVNDAIEKLSHKTNRYF
jgi:Holliday junction resolvase RusA-like endonuclease